MLKSLHYLTASVARVIMLVALFAVGMTVSADRYQISFCEEGMNTFSDRGVRVTSSLKAESTGLTLKTGARDLRFYFDESTGMQEGKGIGRIILTAAPEMSESDLERAVNLPGGTRNYKLVYAGGHKIICTPSNVATFLSLDFNISSSFLGISARTLSLVSAEVFTGYSVQDGFSYELTVDEENRVYSDTYAVEYPFRYTETPSSNAWNSFSRWGATTGVEADVPAGNICTFGENKTAFRLLEGRLNYIPKVNNARLFANEDGRAVFDIFAPAGFAISEVTFRGDGVSRITPEHGTISGNMDRTWRTSEAKPTLDHARFFYNATYDEEWIDFSTITVTYVTLDTQPDVRFRIDASNVSPAVEGDMVFHYNDIDFDVIVTAPEGVQFTSVAPNFDARMTINGNVYVSGVRGILKNDGTILFNVSFPVETYDVEGSFDFMVRFPEGVICADESYNREFCHTFHFFRGVTDDHVKVSPVELANLKELREVRVTSLIGGPFELVADRATLDYSGINGWATVGASVRLVNGAVVYTLDEPLVAGVNVNGETSIFNSPEVVYHLLGLAGGIPFTLTYNFDANINTVSPDATIPATDYAVPVGDVYTLDDCGNGLFVSYAEPITDAAGQPLEHGSNLWASYYDQPEGYQLIATYGSGEGQDDADRSCAGCVLVGNAQGQYGFLVPLDPAEAAVYHLTVPEGTFYVGGKPNAAIDLTWNLVDTEPYDALTIVNPRYQQTYKYVDKLVVAPNVRYADTKIVSVTERVKFAVSENVYESQRFTNREVWATGTLENGQAVYTFDEPLTCDVEAGLEIELPIGILKTEYGNANPYMTVWVDINPNLKYVEVDYTLPNAEEITTYDKLAKELNNFQVIYSASAGTIDYNAEDKFYHNGAPIGYSLYNPNNVGYSGISITHVESGKQISNIDVYVPSDWGWDRTVAFHSNQDLRPGHYRVQCPAGAIRFDDGSVNAPIDITWTLIDSFNAGQVLLADPSPNFQVPFRKMRLAPIPDATTVTEFKFADLAQQTANIDVFYSQGAGRVVGTFSTDENGYLNIEFDKTVEYQGEVKLRIPGGVFYDTTGRVNPELEYIFYIDYYQLGSPELLSGPVTSFSDIHVPILNDVTVQSVPETYTITFRAFRNDAATGERILISELKDRAGFVSLSHDDGGKPELLVSFPNDLIRNCYDNPNEQTTIEVELPGQAYTHVNTNVIPNKEGVPNQALTFEFTVWPNATYSYYFSIIDMPEGVTIRYNGDALVVTPNGLWLDSGDPITADGFSFDGLPEGCECDIAIEGDGLNYKGRLDFSRYAKIIAYPFDDNTVAQDDLEQSFGFVFDREVDATTVNANDLSSCLSLTDANGEPIDFMWANATTSWMGLGFYTDYTLYPGTYTFHAPAKLFRFTDNSWNPEIDYTFTVTEVTHYAFQGIATLEKGTAEISFNHYPNVKANPFMRLILLGGDKNFNFSSKDVEIGVCHNGQWTTMVAEATACIASQFDGEFDSPWISLLFRDAATPYTAVEFGPGEYTFDIPADLFPVEGGLTNNAFTTTIKVDDPEACALNVFVDGSNVPATDFPIEFVTFGSSAGVIGLSGEDVHFNPNKQEMRLPDDLRYYCEIEGYDLTDGVLSVYVHKTLSLILEDGEVDGKGGLRSASIYFDYGVTPALFRSRINWSEGFKLQRKLWFSYLNVANDIAYVTTSVDNNELTLHFFSAEGREFFPMDRLSNYRLTIPVNALFAFGNMVNGYSSDLSFDSRTGSLTLTFDITEPQVVTDDPDYDAEHETVAEQANTFADILLHNRESGGRTNDFNGDGNITIGDLVQFIEQNKEKTDPELEIPANETVIWAGRQAIGDGGNDVFYLGEDGGKEFRENNVKPGTKVRFYFNCSNTEVGNYLNIHEGHWKGTQAYVMLENFDKASGYVTLTLTQEMIDDALTQQWWGGIFAIIGSECFTLTKVTLYTESSGTVDPSDLPDEPTFDPAYDPTEGEEILWVGSKTLDWTEPGILYVGSDGGTELQELGAKVGSEIRVYGEVLNEGGAVNVREGHWMENIYAQFFSATPGELQAAGGYYAFTLTQAILDEIYTVKYWGGSFIIHGQNFRVTKVALYNEPVVEPEGTVLWKGITKLVTDPTNSRRDKSVRVGLNAEQYNALTPGMKVRIYGDPTPLAKSWVLAACQPGTSLQTRYQVWASINTTFHDYVEFELTQEMIANAGTGTTLALFDLGGMEFTVKYVTVLPADNTGWHPTLPGDDSDPVL